MSQNDMDLVSHATPQLHGFFRPEDVTSIVQRHGATLTPDQKKQFEALIIEGMNGYREHLAFQDHLAIELMNWSDQEYGRTLGDYVPDMKSPRKIAREIAQDQSLPYLQQYSAYLQKQLEQLFPVNWASEINDQIARTVHDRYVQETQSMNTVSPVNPKPFRFIQPDEHSHKGQVDAAAVHGKNTPSR